MKAVLKFGVLLFFTSTFCEAKKAPVRDWKEGILRETAFTVQDLGAVAHGMTFPGWGPYAPSMSTAGALRVSQTWEGFRIQAEGYEYMVACPVRRGRMPNVTVNGKIRYATDSGKFYLLDEDNREFEALVIQKAITAPVEPRSAK